MRRSASPVYPARRETAGRTLGRRGSFARSRARSLRDRGGFTGGAGPEEGGGERWGPAAYKVVVPEQRLVVRIMGHDPHGSVNDYLPAVRPYGVLRMAWAIWREIPDVGLKAAALVAWRVRREGEAAVFRTTLVIAEFLRRRLLLRHHLRTRLERTE
ncbi:MAG: hypothetical protein AVDCRST_MAG25-1488 [uncultured Rubrobacteraceae bacterium]|uniref:Uncharacterized protein n=1 Tax=uncultured Rubrobacteraceae bacterium TaxID=349277 RepID=A0A6J4R6G1_9ACTN|nr:MAG: hypothetical protein AVDCRST_MAG25-1488 [uncultured Rubrobacteraceae bacterium]